MSSHPKSEPRSNDESAILAAHHRALIGDQDETEPKLDSKKGELDGAIGALNMMERVRRLDQSSDDSQVSWHNAPETLLEDVDANIDKSIGRFQVIRKLGEGGAGVVLLVTDPQLKRNVALKVPKADTLLNREFSERFRIEAQIAAKLRHPNIVAIHETGFVGPICYIASTFCDGPNLAQWLELRQNQPISPESAAQLMHVLADAVQHAHTRGILHRDIKPSNILFDTSTRDESYAPEKNDSHGATAESMESSNLPKPLEENELASAARLTDFGLAKRMDDDVTMTAVASVIGTPAYMSPEQAEGRLDDIGTHSDVFSLGCVLHELLMGDAPFRRDSPLATLQAIRTENPKSSRSMSSLPRDLSAITLKCLEKQPADRYGSADALATDLQAFLEGRPVSVRHVSRPAKLWRWMKSNPVVSGLSLAVSLLVLAVAIVSSVAVVRLAKAQIQVEEEAENSEAVSTFLETEVFGQASPYSNPNREMTLLETLDHASRRLDGYFEDRPRVEAKIRQTLGKTYFELAKYQSAREHLTKAAGLYAESENHKIQDALQSQFLLARLEFADGEPQLAEELFSNTFRSQTAALGDTHPDTLKTASWLAYSFATQGKFNEAESLFEDANGGYEATLGSEHPDSLDCLDRTAQMMSFQEKLEESAALHRRVLDARARVLSRTHPQYLDSLSNLAKAKLMLGESRVAATLYRQVVQLRRQIMGEDHPDTMAATEEAALALQEVFDHELAERYYQDALRGQRKRFGDDDPRTIGTMNSLAMLYMDYGRYEESAKLCEEALDSRRRQFADEHKLVRHSMMRLASVYLYLDRFEEANRLRRDLLDMAKRLYGENHRNTETAILRLTHGLQEAGEYQEAWTLTEDLLTSQVARYGRANKKTLATIQRLAFIAKKSRKNKKAIELFREVWEAGESVLGANHSERLRCGNQLGSLLRNTGRVAESLPILEESLHRRMETIGLNHIDTGHSLRELGKAHEVEKDFVAAERHYRDRIVCAINVQGIAHPITWESVNDWKRVIDNLPEISASNELKVFRKRFTVSITDSWQPFNRRNPTPKIKAMTLLLTVAPEYGKKELTDKLTSEIVTYGRRAHETEEIADLRALAFAAKEVDLIPFNQILLHTILRQLQGRVGVDDETLKGVIQDISTVKIEQMPLDGSEETSRKFWEKEKKAGGPTDPVTIAAGNRLATILKRDGRLTAAEAVLREIYEACKAAKVEETNFVNTTKHLADIYRLQDKYDEATRFYLRLNKSYRVMDRSQLTELVKSLNAGAWYWEKQSNLKMAVECRSLLCHIQLWLDPDSFDTATHLGQYGRCLAAVNEWQLAHDIRVRELELRKRPHIQSDQPLYCQFLLANTLHHLDRNDEAETLLRETIKDWNTRNSTKRLNAHRLLAEILAEKNHHEEAATILIEGIESVQLPKLRRYAARATAELVEIYKLAGDEDAANEWSRKLESDDATKEQSEDSIEQ